MKNKTFENVSVHAKANIYFEGKVVSHSIFLADGSKKTLGVIYPGSYHFNTEQAEKMEIIRLVETSNMSIKATLEELEVPRSTFYRWYLRYQERGPDGLADDHTRRRGDCPAAAIPGELRLAGRGRGDGRMDPLAVPVGHPCDLRYPRLPWGVRKDHHEGHEDHEVLLPELSLGLIEGLRVLGALRGLV